MLIPLRCRGRIVVFVQVDDDDEPRLSEHHWHLFRGYAARTLGNGRKVFMHREIIGATHRDGIECHHRDGNRLNNRRDNLLATTKAEHRHHHAGHGKSGLRGVYQQGNRWSAQAKQSGKRYSLGCYATPEEASEVVEAWWATREMAAA